MMMSPKEHEKAQKLKEFEEMNKSIKNLMKKDRSEADWTTVSLVRKNQTYTMDSEFGI